jgi:iron complex outermembrane receptor protein
VLKQGSLFIILSYAASLYQPLHATADESTEDFSSLAWDSASWDSTAADIPHVLTPARLHQATAEVPGSVTVLDADFIRRTGIKRISQLLRYVPGMLVAYDIRDNSDAVVYHGGPSILPKSFQVLIDGRAQYLAGLAAVSWEDLPVAVEDIQRIEVVRGPAATSFGTNAYQAVINIITHYPQDAFDDQISAQHGNNRDTYLYARATGDKDIHHWRLSAKAYSTEHLRDSEDGGIGCTTPCDDNRDVAAVMLNTSHQLSDIQSLNTAFTITNSYRDVPDYEFTSNHVEANQFEASLVYGHDLSELHELKISAHATRFERRQHGVLETGPSGFFDPLLRQLDEINPEAADQFAQGESLTTLDASNPEELALAQQLLARYGSDPAAFFIPISGDVYADTNERRIDLEIQDTVAFADNLIMISGIGYRKEQIYSKPFYDGYIDSDQFRGFGNINWRISNRWALHSGVMYEYEEDGTDVWSGKLAANYLISPVESVRLVFSRAGRTPDILEQRADWVYVVDNAETESPYAGVEYYDGFMGAGDLKPQIIHSLELGYFASKPFFNGNIEWDVKLFREELNNVIYHYPSIRLDTVNDGNEITYTGAEGQLAFTTQSTAEFRLTSAWLRTEVDPTDDLNDSDLVALYAPRSHSASWFQPWPAQIFTQFSAFVIEDGRRVNRGDDGDDLHTLELNLYRDFASAETTTRLGFRAQRDFTSNTFKPESEPYAQAVRFQISASVAF